VRQCRYCREWRRDSSLTGIVRRGEVVSLWMEARERGHRSTRADDESKYLYGLVRVRPLMRDFELPGKRGSP